MSAAGAASSGLEPASGLTVKQSRFVVEYLVDLNATQAAIRAGYAPGSAEVTGCKLLSLAKVAAAIQKAKDRKQTRTEITQDRVLQELALLAFSSVDNYAFDDAGNVSLKEGAPPHAMRAVSSIKRRVTMDPNGNCIVDTELKLWDKPGPLKLAGRHVGLFPSGDEAAIKKAAVATVNEMVAQARAQRQQQQAQQQAHDVPAIGPGEGDQG